MAFAAYLLLRGYELLGAIETRCKRKEFGLTNLDPYIVDNMLSDINAKYDEFENMYLTVPHDPTKQVNFRAYYRLTKTIHHSLDEEKVQL
jgi:hypothetical protein